MNVHDYLLDHTGFDWPALLKNWMWLIPDHFTVWHANRFGGIFLRLGDGAIWSLNLVDGQFQRVAADREEFCNRLDDSAIANEWLLIPLVDQLVGAGKTLIPGSAYWFVKPPIIGGEYVIANVAVVPVKELYPLTGELHQQLAELPEGTEVTLQVINSRDQRAK